MKLRKIFPVLGVALVLSLSSSVWAKDGKVTIATFNDMHGKIFSYEAKVVENGKKVKEDVGGIARIATVVREIKKSDPGNVVVTEIGDTVEGPMFFYFHGKAELAGIEAIPVDVGVPGNHEFDLGDDVFVEFLKEANFPIICANLETDRKDINEIVKPTWTTTLKNGTKVGFFGLLCTELASVTSPGPRIKVGQNLYMAANKSIKELKSQGCDVIIALSHDGIEADRILAKSIEGIHAIIGGHSHTRMEKMDVIEGSNGWKTVIGQAGAMARYVGEMKVSVKDGRLDMDNTSWKLIELRQSIAKAEDVEKAITPYGEKLKENLSKKVGTLTVDADASKSVVRGKESALGNYLADSLKWHSKTDIALVNGGGIRGDKIYPAGEVSYNTLMNIYPWGNTVVTFSEITGKELREIMEVSGSALHGDNDEYDPAVRAPSGAFLQISGLKVVYDLSRQPALIDNDSKLLKKGHRVVSLEVKDGNTWLPVKDSGKYSVAVYSWTASGGDKFYTFGAKKGNNTYVTDLDALAGYVRHKNGIVDPYKDGRIKIEK